jgi:ceramide glucosyltransferase
VVLEWLCLVPIIGGSVYGILCVLAVAAFQKKKYPSDPTFVPPVSILKPVYGLEKNLSENLRSACELDYPNYEVVMSAQRLDEPALPIIRRLADEFGDKRVRVAVASSKPKMNGKVQNLEIGLAASRYDVLVISDSDVHLRPDYLRAVVAPLVDPNVGYVCTLYRAVGAATWYERLELLSLNVDFGANLIFAAVTGASHFCLGASTALHKPTLFAIGGLEPLSAYLAEDYEMGRRIRGLGLRAVICPYFVDTVVDLQGVRQWWDHQVYWDQNTRSAHPIGFFATVLTRAVPFAVLFAAFRMLDPLGLTVFAAAVAIRLATAAFILHVGLDDRAGLRSLWLLPLRDILGLASWFVAHVRQNIVWRGHQFGLAEKGRKFGLAEKGRIDPAG